MMQWCQIYQALLPDAYTYKIAVVLYVRSTRQYFFYKYHKRLKRKIKTPQLTFINTNQPKIHK